MRINDAEYRRILDTIDRLTAIDELAAYRAELRLRFAEDPKLDRIERVIDGKSAELLAAFRARQG